MPVGLLCITHVAPTFARARPVPACQLLLLPLLHALDLSLPASCCCFFDEQLLGSIPPSTACCRYKARSYRARSVRDPRAVLKEFGTTLPESTTIHVMDSNADSRRETACQTRSPKHCNPLLVARKEHPAGLATWCSPGTLDLNCSRACPPSKHKASAHFDSLHVPPRGVAVTHICTSTWPPCRHW